MIVAYGRAFCEKSKRKRNDNQEGVRDKITDVAENVIVSRVVEKNQNESVVAKSE